MRVVLEPLAGGEELIERFEAAWRQRAAPAIDDYLPAESSSRRAVLVELVHVDLEFRIGAGETARVEGYLERYPELATDVGTIVDLLAAEYQLRGRGEPDLSLAEYRGRFPQLSDALSEVLSRVPDSTRLGAARKQVPLPATTAPHAAPDDYEILGELGHGGMGIVYKARQKSVNRSVALKMIRAGAHASAELRARFHIEAEALASLQHPNIVGVHAVGEHDGCPYMAMEFVDGGSLDKLLAGQPQPGRIAAEMIATLARAMHAAHLRGIVHRDLKPANILLQSADLTTHHSPRTTHHSPLTTHHPKITDFGLAKRFAEDQGHTATGEVMGTPRYMAPEQARGEVHAIGPPADVYALGAILYEMLTAQPVFPGRAAFSVLSRVESEEPVAPSRFCRKLPRDLETICLKCLQKEPAHRYASAEALADDLRRFLDGAPITARPVGVGERVWKWAKRRPAWATLIVVSTMMLAVLAAMGVAWSAQMRAERDRTRANLRVARKAIDDFYTKMASERLFDEPQLDPLCQELLEKAQALYEELVQEQSADPEVRRDIALAWFRLGEIHGMRDQHADGEHAYGQAIARQEQLRHDYPHDARFRQELANSHNWLGELLREKGQPTGEVEPHYRAALELQQALVRDSAGEGSYRTELARSYYNLGILEKDTNRPVEAAADYDRAIDLLTESQTEKPEEPNVRQDLARALINRGVLRRMRGQTDLAAADYDRAVDLLARLKQESPARAVYKFELAIAWQFHGNLLWSRGRLQDARADQERALSALRGLVADFSTRPRYKKKMGDALRSLGATLAAAGDYAAAEQTWNEARSLFEALIRKQPESAEYHSRLGMTLGNLGWLRTAQENWPAARPLIEQGIEQMHAALEPNGEQPDYLRELRDQCRDLAETLVRLGDDPAAVQAAMKMAGIFPDRAQDSYYAACFIARCVPLAKEKETARQYVDQAVALLRQAVGKAPTDLDRLKDEKQVLASLESHPAFATLRRELDARVPQKTPLP
jgi:tetratricopeptide (TPR) repeat protein